MDELDKKVYDVFSGRVVKKGATKLVKGASNVPTYVNVFLLFSFVIVISISFCRDSSSFMLIPGFSVNRQAAISAKQF